MNSTRIRLLGLGVLWGASVLLAEPMYVSTQDGVLQQADQLEKDQRFQEAIPIYENLIREGTGRETRWTAYVLYRLALAQYQAGDRLSAMESAGTAATLDPAEPSYKSFREDLAGENSGTRQSKTYHARRDQGSAKRLTASNGILHIFVRGRNTDPWDAEDMEKTRQHIQGTDRWLQAQAVASHLRKPPVFEHRVLALRDEPFWRRVDVPDSNSSPEYRKAWEDAILTRFQADSYADLFDRTFDGMDLDNRSVIFHTSARDISLAVGVPYQPEPTDMESVFVMSEASGWVDLYEAVYYTHEFLHLYGADDLFNKVKDPAVPDTDVMSFGAHRLDECLLSDLTRYAIGWTDQRPRLTRLQVEAPESRSNRKGGTHG